MNNYIKDIFKKFQLDLDYKNTKKLQNNSNECWLIEGADDGKDDNILVCDCSNNSNSFDYPEFQKMLEGEDVFFQLIMVFEDWDNEWDVLRKSYESLNKSKEKRALLDLFDKKISYYSGIKNKIQIQVDDYGENYLEYLQHNLQITGLRGRIYNISFKELKKIFNVTGKELFKENVRYGLKNNRIGHLLQLKFKEYIKIGAYLEWIDENDSDYEEIEILKKVFEIEDDFEVKKPDTFWFYHNGITIYGDSAFDFSGNTISVDPQNISVINGAQTLTNFFESIKTLPEEFNNLCENIIDDNLFKERLKTYMDEYVINSMEIIKVKTIFIEGDEKYLQPITCGLNTQIPIQETDILAISETVDSINDILKNRNMKIVKSGEIANVETMFSVIEFVKYYLMILGKPGESKNLSRKKIDSYLKEAQIAIEKDSQYFLDSLSKLVLMDCWWNDSKSIRNKLYTEDYEKLYTKYGKNYFLSYMLKQNTDSLDEESLFQFYDVFVESFAKINALPNLSDFKKDNLYEEYLVKSNQMQSDSLDIDSYLESLKDFLNQNEKTPYNVQKKIREYFDKYNIDLSNTIFRVVATTNGKVREAFPFPNSTFTEIYQNKFINDGDYFIDFKQSKFYKEINKIFPIFIIEWDYSKSERSIVNISFIERFTFNSLEKDAEKVFNKTIECFEQGDEKSFPKMSDNLSFHVRPKAVDSSDTFEFTNGMQLTKRTFWANKKTMNDLIKNLS